MIAQAAAKFLTPCILELGGKSPSIIDKDADLENAALRICQTKFLNGGQICVCTDYVYVHQDVKEAFLKEVTKTIERFFGPKPIES